MMTNGITPESLAEKLSKLPLPSLLEADRFIDYLLFQAKDKKPKRKVKRNSHPVFGMWAKKLEGIDSAAYSLELRRKAARRADARASD